MEIFADIKKYKQILQIKDKLLWGHGIAYKKYHISPLSIKTIKQTQKKMMDNEKNWVEFRKLSVFAGYYVFTLTSLIERYTENAIFRFHETKKEDRIMIATNFLKILSTSIHLKMVTGDCVA